MFLRRLGKHSSHTCEGGHYCPQVLETVEHDFAVVGPLITEEATKAMLPGPGVGPKEGVVLLPRKVMVAAIQDILSAA
jgi:hypothetical protein